MVDLKIRYQHVKYTQVQPYGICYFLYFEFPITKYRYIQQVDPNSNCLEFKLIYCSIK